MEGMVISKSMKRNKKTRGCIKTSRGPWVVQRSTKKGVVKSLRFPTERERQNNVEREKRRREISRRIYNGLRLHGNYKLPKHADNNHLLKALCLEAGWIVQEDGTIFKKKVVTEINGGINSEVVTQISSGDDASQHDQTLFDEKVEEGGIDLTLSLSIPTYDSI
ncbi:unnamed protein product [Amaranthus hypochondriacus]